MSELTKMYVGFIICHLLAIFNTFVVYHNTNTTMNVLFETYGHCIIPKNTVLFRGFKGEEYEDCMFFGTKYFVAKAFNTNVQVWQTKKSLKVLFLVKYLDNKGSVISGLSDLYKLTFLNENIKNLDIKQDVNRRKPFVTRLMEDYEINGWLTSVEDRVEVEVCLFDLESLKESLELIESSVNQGSVYFEDSLKKIKIYPSDLFYNMTNKKLKTTYSAHKKSIQSWIEDWAITEIEKDNFWHFNFDLRLKLKI